MTTTAGSHLQEEAGNATPLEGLGTATKIWQEGQKFTGGGRGPILPEIFT